MPGDTQTKRSPEGRVDASGSGQIVARLAIDELSLAEGAYEMANLRPRTTGLPFVVWISPRGGARHQARVKVSHEPVTDRAEASVSIQDPIAVTAGELRNAGDFEALKTWIELNRDVLLQFWEGRIQYAEDVIERLQKLEAL